MRAGDLRSRVTIQKRTGGTNDWGEPLPAGWADHAVLWASVKHLSGSAAIRGDADTSIVKASIRIRYRDDIDAGMRVLVEGRAYGIKAVLRDEAGREHVDMVAELVT